jgi:hypothetical protein
MSELALLSLLAGSSGLQSVAVGLWLRSQQLQEQALLQDEEEQLTPYDSKETIDPMDDKAISKERRNSDPRLVGWEFKILRSAQDSFRDPSALKQVLEEEAIAGWILLEKLDDRRLRFKRPIAMREVLRGELMPIDPYRTTYGQNSPWTKVAIATIGVLVLVLPSYLGFILIQQILTKPLDPTNTQPLPQSRR